MRNLLKQAAQPHLDLITYIYGLVDPRTDHVRYIGKSDNPHKRHFNHMHPPETNADTKKSRWINKLLRLGIKPSLLILQVVKLSDWQDAERQWISRYRQKYGQHFLTNTTAGGDGIEKGFKQRPGTGEKISAANMGHKVSDETKAKISLSNLGRKRSDEAKKRMSEAVKAFYETLSPEEIKNKCSHPHSWTEEERQKQSKTIRQRTKFSNRSSSFIGVSWSPKNKFWRSYLRFNGKQIDLGFFEEEEVAARARDRMAIELAGESFRLNFPRTEYENVTCENYEKPKHPVQRNNKSGYRGVSFNKRPGRVKRWTATAAIDGKNICLGYFNDEIEAARIYDRWVIQHRDLTAYTNFPRSEYQ